MLYLVRHGRTAHNASRRLLGRLDLPLDDLGERQAAALGRMDVLRGASRVLTSPLERARRTAEALGPPVVVDERWVEIDYGAYDGVVLEDAGHLWSCWAEDLGWIPDGGESLRAVGDRVRRACEELQDEIADHDVVVVSHVSPIKAAVAWALGVGDEITWRMFVDTASVTAIGMTPRGPSLRSFNDTHHRPSS